MNDKQIHGVYAAALTPRESTGEVNLEELGRVLQFLLDKGISAFAINGATGEYCLTRPEQLQIILSETRRVTGDTAKILCGVGAAGVTETIALAKVAEKNRVNGLLLPMPYFFPYEQDDLEAFCRAVASAVDLPILLYNLPQFTSGLQPDTVCRLISEVPNIVGIKDSSGSLNILRELTSKGIDACRIVGNDSALAPALQEKVCDGVVSGCACVVPELIQDLYSAGRNTGSAEFHSAVRLLQDFLNQLGPLPTPWGLKWAAEARNIVKAKFSQPLSSRRKAQGEQLMDWFKNWYQQTTPVSR